MRFTDLFIKRPVLAIVVNQRIRGRTFFRASFYFPAIAS